MKKFRRSELSFLVVGLILIMSSIVLLVNNISLVKFFNLKLVSSDPFEAYYYTVPNASPTPQMPLSTPTPQAQSVTPAPLVEESKELSIYMVSPINQALIQVQKNRKSANTLLFKFEVYPKNTSATLEMLYKDKVVLTKDVTGSSTGSYEISIPIPDPGLYQWRVKAIDKTSELRSFVINEKH